MQILIQQIHHLHRPEVVEQVVVVREEVTKDVVKDVIQEEIKIEMKEELDVVMFLWVVYLWVTTPTMEEKSLA